jgi:hypothetical protein
MHSSTIGPRLLLCKPKNWLFDAHSLNAEWANGQHIWRTNADASAWLQVEMRPGSILEGKEKNKQARVEKVDDALAKPPRGMCQWHAYHQLANWAQWGGSIGRNHAKRRAHLFARLGSFVRASMAAASTRRL